MTLFLMITHAPEKVLKTISSRCLSIRVLPPGDSFASTGMTDEISEYASLFADLSEGLMKKDLMTVLEVGESLAGLSSREQQKAFCRYASERFRQLFLLQQGMDTLAAIPEEERDFYTRFAAACKKSFPRQAVAQLDRAVLLIEHNVSQKILFADLADRLIMSMK